MFRKKEDIIEFSLDLGGDVVLLMESGVNARDKEDLMDENSFENSFDKSSIKSSQRKRNS